MTRYSDAQCTLTIIIYTSNITSSPQLANADYILTSPNAK